jgi:hypothetical protein
MQGANKRTGRPPKKPKLATNKATSEPASSKPSEPATDEPATDKPTTDGPTTDGPAINDNNTIEDLETLANDTPQQGKDGTIGESMDCGLPTITHRDGIAILDEFFQNAPLDSRSLDILPRPEDKAVQESTSASKTGPLPLCANLTSNQNSDNHHVNNNNLIDADEHIPSAKCFILDESGHQLEDVTKALKEADDTSRMPDSSIPGALDEVLAKCDFTEFAKIMTSIVVNCVRCYRGISRPALDIKRERLQETEQERLERIAEDRLQMNMTFAERIASQINNQKEVERLRKNTENTIARLELRKIVESELQNILSEPTEFISEFKEESDYENAIKQVKKENANDIETQQRRLWKQTYY